MVSVTSQLLEEVTAHAQSDSLEDAREICTHGTYFPNNLRVYLYIYIYIYITKGLRQGCSNSPTLFKIYIQNALENWQKMCTKMGLEIQDTTIYSMLFADDHLLIEQDYEDLE